MVEIDAKFQSLFSWNLLLMSWRSCYSLGSGNVSILVFVELALDASESGFDANEISEFQSLFSWNLLLMKFLLDAIQNSNSRFNPCFRGTCSWWWEICWYVLSRRQVSILVFVELALDDGEFDCSDMSKQGFNPCFRGTCSWCFNVCFYYSVI